MTTKPLILLPLLSVALVSACSTEASETSSGLRARVAIQGLDDLGALELRLSPADVCPNSATKGKPKPITSRLDIAAMLWPNGDAAFETADDYLNEEMLLGEQVLAIPPGCYQLVAAPLTSTGEAVPSCAAKTVDVVVEAGVETTLDLVIECSAEARVPDSVGSVNAPPTITQLIARPDVSACDATMVCATASDPDFDRMELEWDLSSLVDQRPNVVKHMINSDRSVTQCIAVQAREAGSYEIGVSAYDLTVDPTGAGFIRVEDLTGESSHGSSSVTIDATLGCEATGRSAVIMLTLSNDPGMAEADAAVLIDNTAGWVAASDDAASTKVLVVLDDAHYGEDSDDASFVEAKLLDAGYSVERIAEPSAGLTWQDVEGYDVVWFINPGHPMDDPDTHTALLRYRASGGGLVLQGDDMARFFGRAELMEPLTYLEWQDNGTIACGVGTDNNVGDDYRVAFGRDDGSHPILRGLGELSFAYGNDIDHSVPLGKGEQVLAWGRFERGECEVETPVVVALEPDLLTAWE